ncbi:hypothetical protein [Gandjariella thermophila]|uniref:Uncharacterized protein n=1 Tax=Gandjariella thermophila TaxID=1931992 RepID=A0A4D4J4R6_9PSEU|nr:hypothetical protein [Gandjariella thermophila]GDY30454.1 hypothetical protein GTS_20870 [Gandjariella thermophila]
MPRRHRASHRRRPPERPLRLTPIVAGLPLLLVGTAVTGMVLHGQPIPVITVADAAQRQANPNCTLIVPADPLSAAGLATPYELVATDPRKGPCREVNPNQTAFVEATIVDPATGALSVYHPLVVDRGTRPAADPIVPRLPQGAVVGLWFGFNGDTLTLRDTRTRQGDSSLQQGQCVNGLDGSPFGQFAYCNAPAFFAAANGAIAAGKLKIPALGKATDGQPCPTTRDFTLVDQDQSDNVTTSYLVGPDRRTAQNTTANAQRFGTKRTLVNGSDNLLLDAFVDPALGCTPFTAPDIGNGGQPSTSLALDELQAAADQAAPVALVPPNDPMAQVDGKTNPTKEDFYRAGVDQPPLSPAEEEGAAAGGANGVRGAARAYCQNLVDRGPQRLQLDHDLTVRSPSPDKAAANNLFTFLAQRLMTSFTELGCGDLLGTRNPVQVKTDRNGVAVDATITAPAPAPLPVPASGAPPVDPKTVPDADNARANEGDPTTW